jgi:hypothetical protein
MFTVHVLYLSSKDGISQVSLYWCAASASWARALQSARARKSKGVGGFVAGSARSPNFADPNVQRAIVVT